MALYVPDAPMTFYHIARNAGSAIRGYLLHHYPSTEWIGGQKLQFAKHWTPWEANTFHFAPRGRDPGTKICIVRNPYDRLVSQYFFLKAHPYMKDWKNRDYDTSSFENWIYNGVWGHAYWPPQHYYIAECDIVIRYENLESEFESAMMQVFGEYHGLKVENDHSLYSDEERLPYTEYFTPEMVDFLINYINKDKTHATWKLFREELYALSYQFGD